MARTSVVDTKVQLLPRASNPATVGLTNTLKDKVAMMSGNKWDNKPDRVIKEQKESQSSSSSSDEDDLGRDVTKKVESI